MKNPTSFTALHETVWVKDRKVVSPLFFEKTKLRRQINVLYLFNKISKFLFCNAVLKFNSLKICPHGHLFQLPCEKYDPYNNVNELNVTELYTSKED